MKFQLCHQPLITEVSHSSSSTLTVDHSIDRTAAQQADFSNTSNGDASIVSTTSTPTPASNTSGASLTSPLSKFLVQYADHCLKKELLQVQE